MVAVGGAGVIPLEVPLPDEVGVAVAAAGAGFDPGADLPEEDEAGVDEAGEMGVIADDGADVVGPIKIIDDEEFEDETTG